MRKELLLDVAYEKFAQKGYNTTLSEIATGAGIKKQSIYNYFENKEDLLYETIKIELLHFYTTKSSEFDTYMDLDAEEALKAIFFSICLYYKDINKLKFWKWISLIESKELFNRCRDLIRENEGKFYNRVTGIIEKEMQKRDIDKEVYFPAIVTFVVTIHGVMDGMLLYHDIYDAQLLIESTWSYYWNGIEHILNKR